MSDQGKSGAQASETETVVEVDAEKVEKTEGAETEAKEGDEEAAEGSEEEKEAAAAERDGEEKTKSAKRRERQKARIADLEATVARLSEQMSSIDRNRPAAEELGPEPDPAKYDSDAKYTAALAAWTVEKSINARQAKTHEANTSAARTSAAEKKGELFRERAMALVDRYPDIEAKVFNDRTLPMSATMAETLMDSEKGPEVAYYLAANREVAQRISSMPPLAAARELGRIEATLSLPKPRTETHAPPPPTTVTGSSGVVTRKTTDASGDALSADEWARRERARVAKRHA